MRTFSKLAVTLMALMFGFYANATPVNDNGTLIGGLDAATLDGDFNQDINADQYEPDEIWTLDAVGAGNSVMMFEIAGFANTNSMGIYRIGDTSTTIVLFDGAAGPGDRASLTIVGNNFVVTRFDENMIFQSQSVVDFGGATTFGFYLQSVQGANTYTFYSQDELNSDAAADGTTDHLIAFQGDNIDFMDPDGDGNYGLFTDNNYILAWEDLLLNASDRDYSDMVVMMESFIPVSEPATLALMGLGLLGFGVARRRRS